jgi:DHA2 family multidrug resistance protein
MTKGLEAVMMTHGSDPATASRQAYVSIWGLIERQASMQAFVDTFLAMAVVFMLMLPLLLVMKKPKYFRSSGVGH